MSTWNVQISGKGVRKDFVDKLAQALKEKLEEKEKLEGGVLINVTDVTHTESRADRFAYAQNTIEDGKSIFEELRDELQGLYDNLPHNFRDGEKGEQLQSAIDELETHIGNLEEATGCSVEFPAMFG